VRQQQLEGVIGKHKDSLYEAGKRTGSWVKYRVNRGQEFVIGGYIPGPHDFDSLIVGYYQGKDLMYVARVRKRFCPATSRSYPFIIEKMRFIEVPPFVGQWGHTKWANLWFVRLIGWLRVPLHMLDNFRGTRIGVFGRILLSFSSVLVLSLCCCTPDQTREGKAKHSFANEKVQSHFCPSPARV
jgi:hypothetical protein